MRLSLALVGLLAATAHADGPPKEDEAFLTAMQRGDAKALADMIEVPFVLANVPFKTKACQKAFGGKKVVAKDRKALAPCLAQVPLHDADYEKWDDKVDAALRCTSHATIGGFDATIVLLTAANHPFKVVSLELKELEGELGGVPGNNDRPICEPPPPQNIPPTTLETYRKAGTTNIPPDAAAQAEIAALKKPKVAASFKMCLDRAGEINLVSLLKTSGSPAYDKQLEATIRNTWQYRPFVVDGNPVRVCTAVTFIYGT